ncbi:monocarboxylate transporter 13 [Biomphalaria glabrata]|uniref:Monocarboxylate transporter 3-like isoform X1 n=1 Tax=Biomphalaria glabrata TaxID=6526 RepID=A0A9W2ZBV8_BIOGL|nr:monocarboxylate transporter 3-like isoform X1 [Biomphalaria glabrata]XP_055872515.1 monocarboxylate transporter 3-like isoform X1 [Biomphalaria glabrata]XP_055872517.1 monocarboxylate transporter 3-like isoform X1 [Biomphalaria glabrata]XP_055872518.1 monocarboxylate transporter 3-like isoform X1 [Biomphalaria glabrata]XP_055872519.1 monocarboxylate transporter 3-like isoform X1 [Biomphalaria glabrata]XP_055872520.1 monocarboxylate transporter 3-like isoform X1 [Biomphalaria glabrata]KAI87
MASKDEPQGHCSTYCNDGTSHCHDVKVTQDAHHYNEGINHSTGVNNCQDVCQCSDTELNDGTCHCYDLNICHDICQRHGPSHPKNDTYHCHNTNSHHSDTCHCHGDSSIHDTCQCSGNVGNNYISRPDCYHEISGQASDRPYESTESMPIFGKYILLLCGTVTFGLSISLPISLSVMFLEWQDAFQVTRAHTAAVHSTCIGIIFSGGIIAGFLMDKFGARATCLIGSFLASFGLFLGFFATNIDFLIATTGVLTGSGFCLLQLPCMPCISKPFTKYRSLSISVCSFGAAAMNLIFPHMYRLLIEHFSWRGAYLIISGLAFNTCVTSFIMTSTVRIKKCVPPAPCEEKLLFHVKDIHYSKTAENGSDGDCVNVSHNFEFAVDKKSEPNLDLIALCIEEKTSQNIGRNSIQVVREMDSPGNQKTTVVSFVRAKMSKLLVYLQGSDWNFLRDPVFLLYLLCLGITLGSLFACFVLLMDVARTKNYDRSTGAIFILTASVANIGGRFVVCLLNLSQRCHSFVILCAFGGIASVAMILLGFITDYVYILICLVFIGGGIGGMVSIYPKCALDISMACSGSYPLALGVTCTSEGIFDFIVPVAIGYMVDVSDNYILPLTVLGCLSLLMMSALMVVFCIQRWKQ